MAEVQIGRGRVQTELDAQRPALGQALLERPSGRHVDGVAGEELARVIPSGPMLEFRARRGLVRPPSHARRLPLAGRSPGTSVGTCT